MAFAMSISKNTLGRAKSDLRNEGKIKSWSVGFKPKKWYMSLTALDEVG